MNFNKRVNGSWTDVPHYIMGTSTDTITTLPADLYPNAVTATVGLKGNMSQSGTPTPQNPIQPSECGDKTSNIININDHDTTNGFVEGSYLRLDGSVVPYSASKNGYNISVYTPIEPNTTYSYGDKNSHVAPCVCEYDENKQFIIGHAFNNSDVITFTTTNNSKYVRLSIYYIIEPTEQSFESYPMFNLGSTLLNYEPYGIKIPILSANTTTPVYLGEVQSTRKIGRKILKGDENITYNVVGGHSRFNILGLYATGNYQIGYCSHYNYQYANQNYNVYHGSNNSDTNIYIFDDNYTSDDDFKAYLAQQYANGTPVTVWYVLATPQTAIVNEPIRKIGDYADTVSGITIPTIAGANSFDVLTTLKPSEVTVNFKGWHPVSSVHERESGQWD